ncbi:MAG: metal-dependent hydrolase [Candidatus Aenigmatarchaeota archaeon]
MERKQEKPIIMNPLLHFLISYIVINTVFGNAAGYIAFIALFSVLPDIDHIPYVIRNGKKLIKKKFGSESRSRFHEMYGLLVYSVIISFASLFFNSMLAKIAAMSLTLHIASDFLVGKSRPFYPFSKKEVSLGIVPEKYRVLSEIILTSLLGVMVWLSMAN